MPCIVLLVANVRLEQFKVTLLALVLVITTAPYLLDIIFYKKDNFGSQSLKVLPAEFILTYLCFLYLLGTHTALLHDLAPALMSLMYSKTGLVILLISFPLSISLAAIIFWPPYILIRHLMSHRNTYEGKLLLLYALMSITVSIMITDEPIFYSSINNPWALPSLILIILYGYRLGLGLKYFLIIMAGALQKALTLSPVGTDSNLRKALLSPIDRNSIIVMLVILLSTFLISRYLHLFSTEILIAASLTALELYQSAVNGHLLSKRSIGSKL